MPQPRFVLGAFDHEQWCQVLQARLPVTDLEPLRQMLGKAAEDDPELEQDYILDDDQFAGIAARFNVRLDVEQLASQDLTIFLFRQRRSDKIPYLIHGGYELPLLLEGRKQLARFSEHYPPMKFKGEEQFDRWVAEGVLHREEVDEPFDAPFQTSQGTWNGLRTVYYTRKGEEWRIPAVKLVFHAAGKSGGWNEYFERLEGMLFGYEDWQNDWWIKQGVSGGGFGGASFCCAVSADGLTWIESSGFRALPPIDGPMLMLQSYDKATEDELYASILRSPGSVAVARFNIAGRHAMNFFDLRNGPYELAAGRIAEFNRFLNGHVAIVARRGDS